MYHHIITLRNTIIRTCYIHLLKPFFFRRDPEDVHDRMIHMGKILGKIAPLRWMTRCFFGYQHPMLEQEVAGIQFKNPVGLAAGFDKNAEILPILSSVGFGFAEIGSITALSCAGNAKPRLWRIPEQQSLRVYYGLKNNGYKEILPRIAKLKRTLPYGVSIAKTNCQATADLQTGINDYLETYTYVQKEKIGKYITINISCPNAFGGLPFTDPQRLASLLAALKKVPKVLPVFLKFSPDMSLAEVYALIDVAIEYDIDGYICTNLTKKDQEKGGLSGKAVANLSTAMVREIYRYTKGAVPIIGLGGVFTAEDAYEKIKAGASLVQLITGMIYGGPQTISEINRGLVKLLEADGYESVSEAVGGEA